MSNIKKIIGVVLALVMALSVASVAFAAPGDAYTVTITADKTELAAGESATVTVALTTNYYASTISIPVFFDKSQVTVSAGSTDITGAAIATETSADAAKLYAGSGLDQDAYGVRAFVYIAKFNANLAKYDNTTVMTFTVTANADATGSVTLECLAGTKKTSTNTTGALYVAKNSSGNAKMDSLAENIEDGTITAATATINFATAGDPDLVLTATGENYGTIIRDDLCTTDYDGCVFGIPTLDGEAIEDYVTANNGYIAVVENDNGVYSTGATIELYNNADELVGTYVFIYFGDVNGDEAVDMSDAGDVDAHDQWLVLLDEDTAAFYSADVNYDGVVDMSDVGDIDAHDQWLSMLEDQCDIAAGFNEVW